ncbi:hypothetical protein GTP45_26950 [Pseudoduganella sp. FT55W]|uniref:Uncharacterized protein n=1 Tax=Duganella rivi TaxID=2666083 RepID=A0A7X4KFF5_9BURK|nr:hypothetical protein [Duganella rivi]MYM70418.1 hypothetical protein [Duganella rivi]
MRQAMARGRQRNMQPQVVQQRSLRGLAVEPSAAFSDQRSHAASQRQRQNTADHSPQNGRLQALQRMAQAGGASQTIQCVFTFSNWVDFDSKATVVNHTMTVKEVFDNIKNTREGKKIPPEDLMVYLNDFDGSTFESREKLLNRLKSDTSTNFTVLKRIQFVKQVANPGDAVIDSFFTGLPGWEFKYKLALAQVTGHAPMVAKTIQLLQAIQPLLGADITPAGVQDMLSKAFTTVWELAPEEYLTGDATDVLNGFITTQLGVNGELETLINAAAIGAEQGEQIFSGAKYSESTSLGSKVEEDVDVSFIDSDGVLNLIEAGYSVKAVRNKLMGPGLKPGMAPDGQKQRYQHLAGSSQLEQAPVGGLTGSMAANRSISGIKLYYSVPVENFDRDIYTPDGLETISNLIKINAGLMLGTRRISPLELQALKVSIEVRLGQLRDRLRELETKLELEKMAEREETFSDNDAWADDDEYLSRAEAAELARLRALFS